MAETTAGKDRLRRHSGGRAAGVVIEGEATVLARRTPGKPEEERQCAAHAFEEALAEAERAEDAEISPSFVLRVRSSGRGNTSRPDLVFSEDSRPRGSNWARTYFRGRQPPDGSLSGLLAKAGRLNAARSGALVAGFLLGFFALPVFLVAAPERPVAATVPTALPPGLTVSDIETMVSEHKGATVVTVSGLVRAGEALDMVLPPLTITVSDGDGNTFAKPFILSSAAGRGETVGFATRFAALPSFQETINVSLTATPVEAPR